ncbi:TPA: hypothetical protein L9K67_004010 [Klebsiella pneumoniae]|nr:hypothetical protein [Klebsiella pneumoniae]
MKKWRRLATTKKTARAVFKQNEVNVMQNHHIMALALALCNAGTNSRVTIPRLTGRELRELLEWLSVLRVTV